MRINALLDENLIVTIPPSSSTPSLSHLRLLQTLLRSTEQLLSEPVADEWQKIIDDLMPASDNPFYQIIVRHEEIKKIRESFRLFIESNKSLSSLYAELLSRAVYNRPDGTYELTHLYPVDEGISGTYFLFDESNRPLFVIKPFDEEAGCINNPKWFSGLSDSNPIRDYMPLYHSAMREVLAYQIALQIGVGSIAPETVLAIIRADQFYDYSQHISLEELANYLEQCGPVDREKLCSVQEYVPNAKPLWEMISDLERSGLTPKEVAARFDQDDFENVNLLLWTTYDTDAHMGNLLAYPKSVDEFGHQIYGIKKIDNGLAFPDRNKQLRNNLAYMENAHMPLSDAAKEKIAKMDVEALAEQFKIYGLDSAIPALKERIPYLQKLAQQPDITIYEINKAMAAIEAKI